MKHILAAPQRELLAQLAWSNVLLGFDYDGTLAPIVADPARAELRADTRRLLTRLAELYPCVVVSGRAVATSSASIVLPVPGSPLINSGRCQISAALTASFRSSVAT